MQIPAQELRHQYSVFGHFYSIRLDSGEQVDCRSVLEIVASHFQSNDLLSEPVREQVWFAGKADTLTVNRADGYSRRHPIDLILGPSDPQLSFSYSRSDLRKIDALMQGTQRVILVAGLGGQTGTNLITRFAASALCAEVPVASVVTTPFEFEGKRNAVAQRALSHLVRLSGRTLVIDNERVLNDLSGDVFMSQAFDYVDNLVIAEVRNLLKDDWHG